MLERRWRHPHVAAAGEDLPEHRVTRPADESQVVLLREHDLHLHAPHRGHVECLKDGVIGQEVGSHDPHRPLRGGEGPDEHEFDPPDVGVVRAETHTPGQHRAGGIEHRLPGWPAERFLGGEGPVFDEHLQQLGDHGPGESEVGVADGMAWLVRQPAAVADVEAAGEPDPAVYHQDLAVVSQVGIRKVERHARRQKARHFHSAGRQHAGDRREGVGGADAVDEHADLDAPGGRPAKRRGEDPAGRVVVEDIGGDRHASGGPVDRLEHQGVGLVSAVEGLDRVAVH